MAHILVPSSGHTDWERRLADPRKQWRTGFSARTLAHCWEASAGFPTSVQALFDGSPLEELRGMKMLLAIPEYRVRLPGGTRPSQTDLFVLARARDGLAAIAVEGKVAETFGPLVSQWLAPTPSRVEGEPDIPPSEGKRQRLDFLCAQLGLSINEVAEVRYQLLHRTASALIEAERFFAKHAVMLVHSFGGSDGGFDEYARFGRLFGVDVPRDQLVTLNGDLGARLHIGWATGERRFLQL